MNFTQKYYLLHQAKDEVNEIRKSAWDVMDLQNPNNDNLSDEMKLRYAKDYFYSIEQSVKETKQILFGLIIDPVPEESDEN